MAFSGKRTLARKALAASVGLFCLAVPVSIAGANIAWGLMLASLLAYAALGGKVELGARKSVLEKPLWFFLAASVLAAVFGADPAHSFRFLHQDIHKVWLYTLFMIVLAVEPSPKAVYFMAAGFLFAALVGISQTLPFYFSDVPKWDWVRAHAFVHPATYGEQMAIAVLGGVCFLYKPMTGMRRWHLQAFLLLIAAALLLSHTRAAMAACAGGLFAAALLIPKLRRWLIWSIPVLLVVFLTTELMRPDRSLILEFSGWKAPDYAQGGQGMRLHLWKVALRMGADHPVFGVGYNNFRALFPQYLSAVMDGRATDWGTAHNLYLHHFAERGLVGVLALLAMLGAMWVRALKRALKRPDAWQLWAFSTVTAFLLMNMTEVALQVEILWLLVFFVWVWAEILFRRTSPHISGKVHVPHPKKYGKAVRARSA